MELWEGSSSTAKEHPFGDCGNGQWLILTVNFFGLEVTRGLVKWTSSFVCL